VAVVSALLSLLGLSQYLGHDFFQTALGQCLITPRTTTLSGVPVAMWDRIAEAAAQGKPFINFVFQNGEIYQTVYNVNYVSFYLTLLIPLVIMLFITEKGRGKKCLWGALFSLLMMNLIGSASSSGFWGCSYRYSSPSSC
jgi:hypothetical protein